MTGGLIALWPAVPRVRCLAVLQLCYKGIPPELHHSFFFHFIHRPIGVTTTTSAISNHQALVPASFDHQELYILLLRVLSIQQTLENSSVSSEYRYHQEMTKSSCTTLASSKHQEVLHQHPRNTIKNATKEESLCPLRCTFSRNTLISPPRHRVS